MHKKHILFALHEMLINQCVINIRMRNRKALLCIITLAILLMPVSSFSLSSNELNGGWLEERDGVKILHISGSPYEMGYQYGSLLKNEIKENVRIFLGYLEKNGYPYDRLVEIWNVMKDYLPREYIEEMQGMADGAGLYFDDVAAYNTWPAVFNHLYCCGMSAWGSATSDGRLYHLRSLDWGGGFGLRDAETGKYLRENQILIVRKPKDAYSSICPQFAGDIFAWGGINEKGIAIGETTCLTYDTTFHGISAAFRMRMVLDHASNANEAINIMSSNRTCGWNFVISDGKIPMGYVIEQTANILYVGTWFDPVEKTSPFWEIENVVRRSPMFISPMCAATQKERPFYDPSGLRGFLFFLVGKNPYFVLWSQYKALSNEIDRQWGSLDLNSTMEMLRDVYLGKTDFLFFIMQKFGSFKPFHQWVACPESGDIVISFASKDKMACENPVHYFNLYKLLEEKPP